MRVVDWTTYVEADTKGWADDGQKCRCGSGNGEDEQRNVEASDGRGRQYDCVETQVDM